MKITDLIPKYSILKNKKTDEYHIFKTKPTSKDTCIPLKFSLCEAVNLSDTSSLSSYYSCKDEDTIRLISAQDLKRKMCGNCIRNLYGTFDK